MKSLKTRWLPCLPWIAIALLGCVQFVALPGDYLGYEEDDAGYVLAAHSLLHGEYRAWMMPGNPPLLFLPPGLPVILMPAAALSGDITIGYHLTAWIILIACDILALLWLRRRLKSEQAYWALALFALNPLVLARAGKVMPEAPVLALILGLCLAVDSKKWPGWASGFILGYMWLVRQRATAFFAAIWIWYAIKRRWKDMATSIAAAGVPVIAWSIWLARGRSKGMPEINEFLSAYANAHDILPAITANIIGYTRLIGRIWVPYFPAPAYVEGIVGALFILLCLLGIYRIVRSRGYEPALGWLIFGVLMHLVWPWQYDRYLLPFLPMFIWCFIEGLNALSLDRTWMNAMLAVLLVGQFLGQSVYILSGRYTQPVPELRETYAWIKQQVPMGDALASPFFSRDAFYTGRPFANLPGPGDAQTIMAILKRERVRYILMQRDPDIGLSLGDKGVTARALRSLQDTLEQAPFKTAYRNIDENATIYTY